MRRALRRTLIGKKRDLQKLSTQRCQEVQATLLTPPSDRTPDEEGMLIDFLSDVPVLAKLKYNARKTLAQKAA